MTHCSLFSGIRGFDLAAHWAGWENVIQCEINQALNETFKIKMGAQYVYTDIRKTDFTRHRGTIGIVSGGFPCQPFSGAGSRKGDKDGRYLWPEMFRAIREIQPAWVVAENVYGLLNWSKGMVFARICSDLESQGYEVWPFIIPARAVGARHKRNRLWIIAYSDSSRQKVLPVQETKGSSGFAQQAVTRISFDGKEHLLLSAYSRNINGVPAELDRIESIGNAIVPQVAYTIFQAINNFMGLVQDQKSLFSNDELTGII